MKQIVSALFPEKEHVFTVAVPKGKVPTVKCSGTCESINGKAVYKTQMIINSPIGNTDITVMAHGYWERQGDYKKITGWRFKGLGHSFVPNVRIDYNFV